MKYCSSVISTLLLGASGLAHATISASPLDISLQMVGNTEVKATIRNLGSHSLKFFTLGTILDDAPTDDLHAFTADKDHTKLEFKGIHPNIMMHGAHPENQFKTIPGHGGTAERIIDLGLIYDFSAGGLFDIVSGGRLPTATINSTIVSGSLPLPHVAIQAEVNGTQALEAQKEHNARYYSKLSHGEKLDPTTGLQIETVVTDDCPSDRQEVIKAAISLAHPRAQTALGIAQSTAEEDKRRMRNFFKGDDDATRSVVVGVFELLVSSTERTDDGIGEMRCNPGNAGEGEFCAENPGVIAYTANWVTPNYVVFCDGFFDNIADQYTDCNPDVLDKPGVILHEFTHMAPIKGTSDYTGYGFDIVESLTHDENLNHADTYALYAEAAGNDCSMLAANGE